MDLRYFAYKAILPIKNQIQTKKLIRYYKGHDCDDDLCELISYVKKTGKVCAINYSFTEKYAEMQFDIHFDEEKGYYFVYYHNKKMYFSPAYQSRQQVTEYLRTVYEEQDQESPHCYLTESFTVEEGDVVVDAGVAEGNFGIDVVEKCKKLILVECEHEWCEALRLTFQKEIEEGKVVIIEKMLGNRCDEKEITLDEINARYGRIDFVKMDIEGAEQRAILGGMHLIQMNPKLKMAVCTYHSPEAYNEITGLLGKQFHIETSRRYIVLNPVIGWKPPYARRGLIRAVGRERVMTDR